VTALFVVLKPVDSDTMPLVAVLKPVEADVDKLVTALFVVLKPVDNDAIPLVAVLKPVEVDVERLVTVLFVVLNDELSDVLTLYSSPTVAASCDPDDNVSVATPFIVTPAAVTLLTPTTPFVNVRRLPTLARFGAPVAI
jgi:hypothetical protein